ncbi:MAG: M15 family peptidase [Alphaproteobacteria bacterium]|nr:MAG: M15 family peptidase [Alphaproteobacteria bacterium]
MPQFSAISAARLASCDARLQAVFNRVIEMIDCSILVGHRDKTAQNAAYVAGRSRLDWPKSKHNRLPSLAVDAVPYPIDWDDRERFYLFAGIVLATAAAQGTRLRWGGDWNGDFRLADNRFDDLPHFEIEEG